LKRPSWDALQRQAVVWVAGYLVLIPFMAWVYTWLGNGAFYDSNLQREAGTMSDALRLRSALNTAARRHAANRWARDGKLYQLLTEPVVTQVLHPPGPGATLAFEVETVWSMSNSSTPAIILKNGAGREWFALDVAQVSISGLPPRPANTFGVQPTGPYGIGAAPNVLQGPPASVLFPPTSFPGGPAVVVTPDVSREIRAMYQADVGDPAAASGLFFRMMYFSATTITTLGLGDIQPVSATARNLVTFEAIAGVVLIGLFLNAIAKGRNDE
jgi:hypothetical protein